MKTIIEKLAHRTRVHEIPGSQAAENSIAFEAVVGGEVVGRVEASHREGTIVIQQLDVLPTMRRRGIGRKLVRAILNKSQLLSVDRACVTTNGSEGFWALQGFRPSCDEQTDQYPQCQMTRTVPPIVPANPFR